MSKREKKKTRTTNSKKMEEMLAESEKRYKSLAENVTDILLRIDLKGNFTYMSKSIESDTGYSREEIENKNIKELLTPESYKMALERIKKRINGAKELPPYEVEVVAKGGGIIPFELNTSPVIEDGKLRAIQIIARNIAKRTRAEKKLHVAAKEWQETFDSITDIVALISPDHEIIRVNKAGRESLGKKPEELVGKKCYKVVHGLDVPIGECPCVKTLKTGKPGSGEFSQGGRHFTAEAWPIFDENNKIKAFVHTVKDTTESKRAEEQIRRSNDTQTTINSLLSLSLEDVSINEIMKRALDLILSIPWLALESRGSIFLVEDEPNILVMKVQNGLAEPIQKSCARVPFGRCLCGKAALKQEVQFTDHLDESHETTYEGILPHGHYCVPILLTGRVLGVINLYLKEGHRRDKEEEEFLRAVANALAGIIERKNFEKKQREFVYNVNDISRGECYLLKSRDVVYRIFTNLLLHGVPGLCISREKPDKLIQHGISKEKIVVMSSVPMEGFETIDDLQKVSMRISDFLKENNESVIILDGLEYLISRSSFETVYKFIQEKRFSFIEPRANLLIPIDLATLTEQERALLTNEIKLLG